MRAWRPSAADDVSYSTLHKYSSSLSNWMRSWGSARARRDDDGCDEQTSMRVSLARLPRIGPKVRVTNPRNSRSSLRLRRRRWRRCDGRGRYRRGGRSRRGRRQRQSGFVQKFFNLVSRTSRRIVLRGGLRRRYRGSKREKGGSSKRSSQFRCHVRLQHHADGLPGNGSREPIRSLTDRSPISREQFFDVTSCLFRTVLSCVARLMAAVNNAKRPRSLSVESPRTGHAFGNNRCQFCL